MSRSTLRSSIAGAIVAGIACSAGLVNVGALPSGYDPDHWPHGSRDWFGDRNPLRPQRNTGVAAAKRQARKRRRGGR